MFAVHWIHFAHEIPNELWERCFPPPLEGRWWYEALGRAGLESQFEFFYGVIESAGEPVGIAPAFLMDLPLDLVAPGPIARLLPFLPALRFQRTLFVGSPCAEEGTVGLAPGIGLGEAAPAIQDALEGLAAERKAAMIVWKDFREEAWPPLEGIGRERGLFRVVSFPNTRMPAMPGGGFEAYLKTLGTEHRRRLKKKLRLSHAQGELETKVIQHPSEAELEEIFALFWQTYTKGAVKFERLTPAFFKAIAEAEPAWFITLRDPRTGRMAAFKLCFLTGRRLINKYIGIDYTYGGNWYLYFRLREAEVNWAARFAVTEWQCGQTGYSAKFDLGYLPVPLNNYCKHRNRIMNAVLGLVARMISWSTLDDTLAERVKAHGLPPAYGGEAATAHAADEMPDETQKKTREAA